MEQLYLEMELPHFHEDSALYNDDMLFYLNVLQRCNALAVGSAQKPSLDEYDEAVLHDE